MSISKLEVFPREAAGSNAMKRLRGEGFVPGVLYGLKREPRLLQVRDDEMATLLREGNRTVELSLGGQVQTALLKDLQYDHLGDHVIHADFVRVDLAETLRIRVPIRFSGVAKGHTAGGIVEHKLSELEVECLPDRIPDEINVALTDLDVGQSIHVRELELPAGVTSPLDPETVVVSVSMVAVEAEEEEAEAPEAEDGQEPEVIQRKEREGGAEE